MTRDHALCPPASIDRFAGVKPDHAALGWAERDSIRKRRKRGLQGSRCLERLVRFGDGTDYDYSSGPRVDDLHHIRHVDAADRKPRPIRGCHGRRVFQETGADRLASRLRRSRPHGAHTEIIDVDVRSCLIDLLGRVSRQAQSHGSTEKGPCRPERQVILTEVKDGASRSRRDVGAIIDRPQFAVPIGGFFQDVQDPELRSRFEGLVAKLDDVDSAGECRIDELGEVTLVGAGIRAQVQLR